MNMRLNYPFLPPSLSGILLPVEMPQEIMADKIVALANTTSRIRYRDIWDIGLLSGRLDSVNTFADIVEQKIMDYSIHDFDAKLEARIQSLPDIVESTVFRDSMQKLLISSTLNRTLMRPEFRDWLAKEVSSILVQTHDALSPSDPDNVRWFM